MLVMKVGGSSVADRAQIERVLAIVRGRKARSPILVSSAHKGITNALIGAGSAAARGESDSGAAVIARQKAVAKELGAPDDLLAPFYGEIEDLLRGIRLVKEMSLRSLDYIASFGERMTVRVIADFFTREGLAARAYDVWDLGFVTDGAFGQARPLEGYERRMRAAFAELPSGEIPVVTGFVGKNAAGEITTVGRNGSDLTATLVAAAVGAEEVEIWSDTDGVMSADPHLVAGAKSIPTMSFDEAAELAYFGSRVLHPEALLPAIRRNIPVRVLNTNRPDHPGTVIERAPVARAAAAVTSIAYKEGQSILTVSSPRMFAQSGFLSKLFEATARHGMTVDMVATSEVAVSMTANDTSLLERVAEDVRALGDCRLQTKKTILAVVGQHLPTRPGVARSILDALAGAGVNVELISYAAGSINFSMVIDDTDVDRAVTALHSALFEGE